MMAATERYCFGDFMLDVSRGCLQRAGCDVALRPKSYALLNYLVAHAGRLVSKDELFSALWPNVVVTDDSLSRCVSEVRTALGDTAQRVIKTVARRGYMFTEPVQAQTSQDVAATQAAGAQPMQVPVPVPPARPRLRPHWPVLAAVLLLVVGGVIGLFFHASQRVEPPARLSVVVLPFVHLGSDPGQAWLADAVSDDLTVALSRLHGASVISTGTAATFKGKSIDVRALGTDLRVRYALQGSVSRRGDSVRISASLVDTRSARSLWTDQFDVQRADLVQAQEEIVGRFANALDLELVRAASRAVVRTGGAALDAEDLAMQCEVASTKQQGESGAGSYGLCEQALQLDPGNVRALVRLAFYYGDRVERVQSPDPPADLARAREWLTRALAADPMYYAAHCANAVVLAGEHRVRDAIVAAERCRDLNPSHARAYRILATLHFFMTEPEQTLALCDRGMLLSPRDPLMPAFLLFKGWGHFMLGHDEEALAWLRKAAAASPDSPSILAPLTSVLALTGRDAEAHAMLERYLGLQRTRTRTLAQWDHRPVDNPAFYRFADRFKSGLRRAGMPER